MIDTAKILIEFHSYWIAGGGRAGAGLDAVTECDDCGCPAMPMSQVKGTLRETATRLWSHDEIVALFGDEASRSPLDFIGKATLSNQVRRWFALNENAEARRQLFRRLSATRINEAGVADDRTLRRIQAAVPLTLEGRIAWRDRSFADHPNRRDWWERLDALCAATVAFGKGKADGLGRAIASCIRLEESAR